MVAVVVVVSEVPRCGVDGCVAAPALECLAGVHACLVVGAEVLVGGVVAALLACAAGSFAFGLVGGAACACGDEGGAVGADSHGRVRSQRQQMSRWWSGPDGRSLSHLWPRVRHTARSRVIVNR